MGDLVGDLAKNFSCTFKGYSFELKNAKVHG